MTIALSTSARKRSAAAASSVTIASVWCEPCARDMRQRARRARRPPRPSRIASRYSVSQSLALGRHRCAGRAPARARRRAARSRRRAARASIGAGREARVDQQRLHRAADAGAAHLGVERDRARLRRIGGGVDVGVADAVEMGEHRHARIGLDARDEALAAARDDHVDQARRARSIAPTAARSCVGTSWTASAGSPRRVEPCDERGVDRAVANATASLPPRRSTALPDAQAQRGGVGGDVGAAFVDDADHARSARARAGSASPLGRSRSVDHLADRIGQRGDRLDRRRRSPSSRAASSFSRSSIAALRPMRSPRHVLGVGGEDFGRARADRAAAQQRRGLLLDRGQRQACARGARARAHVGDQRRWIDRSGGVHPARPSTVGAMANRV